jgi:hypothetical protein
MNTKCRDAGIDETPQGTILAGLKGYQFVWILF